MVYVCTFDVEHVSFEDMFLHVCLDKVLKVGKALGIDRAQG